MLTKEQANRQWGRLFSLKIDLGNLIAYLLTNQKDEVKMTVAAIETQRHLEELLTIMSERSDLNEKKEILR